jgi:predicted HTH transcriptional regulator
MARFRGIDRLAEFDDTRQYWGHAFSLLQRAEFFINIIEWCKEDRNPSPEWIIRSGSVVSIFKPSPEMTIQQPESQLGSLRSRVTKLLQKGPLSKSEISKRLGQKRTSGQLNKVMTELLAEGIVAYSIPEQPGFKDNRP